MATAPTVFSLSQGRAHADNLRALVDAGTEKAADGSIVPWRVTVDLNALRRFNPEETAALIQRPMNYMTAFQEAALKVKHSVRENCRVPQLYTLNLLLVVHTVKTSVCEILRSAPGSVQPCLCVSSLPPFLLRTNPFCLLSCMCSITHKIVLSPLLRCAFG